MPLKVSWISYRIEDFIPFTADVYLDLITRSNGAYWPLQMLLWAVAATAVALPFYAKGVWPARFYAGLAAILFLCSGLGFLHQFYGELVWANTQFALAFYTQAGLLCFFLLQSKQEPKLGNPMAFIGLAICVASLLWPLITGLPRGNWQQAEWVGLHPDPTALMGLGLALLGLKSWRVLICCLIPLSWLLISVMTQHTLGMLG